MDQVTEQQDNQLTASPACTISVPKAIPWRTAGAWAARVPASAWVVLALFLCAALIMAIQAAFVGRDANLRLKVQHNLRSADLSVWVDGDLVYSGKLVGIARKKFGLTDAVSNCASRRSFPELAASRNRSERLSLFCTTSIQLRMVRPLRWIATDDRSRLDHFCTNRICHQRTAQNCLARGRVAKGITFPGTVEPRQGSAVAAGI